MTSSAQAAGLSAGLPFVPYCGAPPLPEGLWQAWNWDPVLLAGFALAAVAYAGFEVRHRQSKRGQPDRRWRRASCFAGAWLVLFAALVSPFCNLTSALFSARVAQHLLMIQLAAPLLVLAWPGTARRAVKHPEIAWILHGATIWTWHLPGPYMAALADDAVLWAMHLSMLVTAVAAWRTLLRSEGAAAGRPAFAAFGTSMHLVLLSFLLVFAKGPLFPYHLTTTQPWGLSPLEDQQLGGLIMWVPGGLAYLVAALWALARWLSASGRGRALERG
ncbi:cytochrome c oxidase assembly protein [Azospirillum rugosum]|uniref:Membrane protein n=1 Tax=Azospirillum rugosum TaxID=416170 RepID=A0ABS4SXM5_9PROT|nr:cytochrome c oxidase assembly protein [Azospirillum rugosum]MBP2296125.1 putative membrane protein [Azospirillum rugosum]MDQ0530806.1 putative membrane protein [Azospirillum rugosum]